MSKFIPVSVYCLLFSLVINAQQLKFPPDEKHRKIEVSDLAKPGYLKPVKDPDFGTTIVRITDSTVFGKKGVRHHYSKDQPWNCDQSLILMEKWILDGNTYKILRKMEIPEEPRWSFKDPEKLFGVKENSFVSFNVKSGKLNILYTFAGFDKILIGPWEGNVSADDRYVALQGSVSGEWHVIVFDIQAKKILASEKAIDLGPYKTFDWVTISPSGKYVVINFRQSRSSNGGIISYDRKLNKIADIFATGEHGDLGYDAEGNEVFVQVCPFQYGRLDNGAVKSFHTKSCGHMSLRNYKRPGWCYTSVNESYIMAIKLDDSGLVERFTNHRSSGSPYNAEPHAVPSPDGKRIMFASDWKKSGENNSYVVYLEE